VQIFLAAPVERRVYLLRFSKTSVHGIIELPPDLKTICPAIFSKAAFP
jgi:hypothetical protein